MNAARRLAAIGPSLLLLASVWPNVLFAAPPVVKTVRVLSANPLVSHDVCSGTMTRVKGTSDVSGANIQYTWDVGDGTPVTSGTVTDPYVIEATHTYTGAVGTQYIAKLTVRNTATGESSTKDYPVLIQPCILSTRVNSAIDEGLWYLHKTMTRSTSSGVPVGYWTSGNAASGYYAVWAANVNAFEVNGFLKTGTADDPYTETVARGLDYLFALLTSSGIGSQTNSIGTFNPDTNGNGIGVLVNQSYPFYQGGPFVDAIVASQTPNAIAALGPGNVAGRRYRDIVQDMIDYFSYCQYDGAQGGGWRYSCNEFPDNSACQWVAIGAIPSVRQWGLILPNIVRQANVIWLSYSQFASGQFGYTGLDQAWGYYATTPSGMVQLVMDGIGRGNSMWDRAETFMRNNFGNGGGAGSAPKAYYYGLFSFTKSLLLHDSNNDSVAEPLKLIKSSTAGVPPMKWYDAEVGVDQGFSEAETGFPAGVALGMPSTHGVARTLVDAQNSAGYWYGHNYSGEQYPFETAWAVIMLRRTVVDIPPEARAEASPNPALAGQVITFNGATSYHPDANKTIVSWDWDLDNNGTFETSGITATRTFTSNGTYTVTLRVTDNSKNPDGTPHPLTDTATVDVVVRDPPITPTANAGGPYNFCLNRTPWFLDGRGSINPDEGVSEPGRPGNTIIDYSWDLDGDAAYDDATGFTPNVTAFFSVKGVGAYPIQLKVTDNSSVSHPSYTAVNLFDTDQGQVFIRAATDPACGCVNNLAARPKPGKADLTWTWRSGAHHYRVYRGTTSGGPYTYIGQTMAPGMSNTAVYADMGPLTNGVTYYYVVREAANNNDELCQSNQASATPVTR